ncbi:MAG: aldo/keto reductase [Candidatus Bathyarchaeum tardum]|nr:MAG: aldo/keto reductase [Candidatus Bathyarchaeum tardum]
MQKRKLGRTGLEVSVVGFGGTWISELPLDDAVKIVQRAFELGINYFDTAKLDGDSEEKLGAALKDVRDGCVLATKTASRTKSESLDDFKNSLRCLQTDWLDLIQLHGVDDVKTLQKAMGPGGSLDMCRKARSEGLVDFIGITGHKPRVLIEAIKTNEFDTVLVPLNIITRQALDELIPLANDLDIGVIAMKPLMAKTSRLITCLYQPSLSLLSDEPELKSLLGQDVSSKVHNALSYVLDQDVSVAITGFKSVEEVETAAQIGNNYNQLTNKQKSRFSVKFEQPYCRDCGLCFPCPETLDIAAILRFKTLYETYGLKNWAKKLYSGLPTNASSCTNCGECEPKCPYNLPVVSMLKQCQNDLGR